jgi:quercetin dioxygenase-like cupin family protein
MIQDYQTTPVKDLGNGVQRRVLASGGGMMTVEFRFAKGSVGALHSHVHEQIGYVVSGRFSFTLDGRTQTLGPGDSYYVPSNVVHGCEALEDGVLLDAFTPQRQDFLG